MYLHGVGSSDHRFKALAFHEGINIVLSERAAGSDGRRSRNGAGKTSFVLLLRYLLAGQPLDRSILREPQLYGSSFFADVCIDGQSIERVKRYLSGEIELSAVVDGVPSFMNSEMTTRGWRDLVARSCYGLEAADGYPTLDNLCGQVLRTRFTTLKVASKESDWTTSARLGYFLGFSREALSSSREVSSLNGQIKAVHRVMKTGALGDVVRDATTIAAEMSDIDLRIKSLRNDVQTYRVDRQYEEHQDRADALTGEIRGFAQRIAASEYSARLIQEALAEEEVASDPGLIDRVHQVYEEAGLLLPDVALRRYEEVEAFHRSVVRNRRLYLEGELESLKQEAADARETISELDQERASIMELLESSMALEAYDTLQKELATLDGRKEVLTRQLDAAKRMERLELDRDRAKADASHALSTEELELKLSLAGLTQEFKRLCKDIYHDREGSLEFITKDGKLKALPKIEGDKSNGIASVRTFLFDMVVLRNAMRLERAPRLIVHDSALFDAMDERQVASCLNIGARLAEEEGFQYVVLLNSDTLQAADSNGFDSGNSVLEQVLDDSSESGGLFGFRFL